MKFQDGFGPELPQESWLDLLAPLADLRPGGRALIVLLLWLQVFAPFPVQAQTSARFGTVTVDNINGTRYFSSAKYASLDAAVLDVPAGGLLVIPANATASATAATITVNKSFSIWCNNPVTSILKATGSNALFTAGGTVESFNIGNCKIDGNGTSPQALNVPDFGGGVNWTTGSKLMLNNYVTGFTNFAFKLGVSAYPFVFENHHSILNCGDISADSYAEFKVYGFSTFWQPRTGCTNPKIKIVGGSAIEITGADFEHNSDVASTGADILIAGANSESNGHVWIERNKLGPENDVAGRYKIQVNGTSTRHFVNLRIQDNNFSCGVATNTAIRLNTMLAQSQINNNWFNNCQTWVDDTHTTSSLLTGMEGTNEFLGNRIGFQDVTMAITQMTAGGHDLARAEFPLSGVFINKLWNRGRQIEAPKGLQNRIIWSEALNNWTQNNVTVTTGQADRYGTTRAVKLARNTSNGPTTDNLQIAINTTGMGSTIACRFGLKSGSMTNLGIGLYDATIPGMQSFRNPQLTSTFDDYYYVFGGLNPADVLRVILYPTGVATDYIYIDRVQCADFDSDYVVSTGSLVNDAATGTRWELGAEAQSLTVKTAFVAKPNIIQASEFCSDAGGTDSYACSLTPAITAYTTGVRYWFKANTANTGIASLNLNSVGAQTIKKRQGGITTDLADNDIRSGAWVGLVWDGTNFQCDTGCDGNAAAGSGLADPGANGILRRTALNTTAVSTIPSDATQFLNGAATPAYAAVKDSDLSTSDITTNNHSSTKHGFAPKSPADATQFLNGAATPAYAAVKDSDVSTSDITTNNASTSKHGFLKKLDNVATDYMDGTGNYSQPYLPAFNAGTITLDEEFCSNSSATNNLGAYGWSVSQMTGSAGTSTFQSADQVIPNLCNVILSTNDTTASHGISINQSGNQPIGMLGALGNTSFSWDSFFVSGMKAGTANSDYRAGWTRANSFTSINFSEFFGLRCLATTPDTNFQFEVIVASVSTLIDTGIACDTTNHRLRVRNLATAGKIEMTLYSSTGTLQFGPKTFCAASCDATVTPPTQGMSPVFAIMNSGVPGSARSITVDKWWFQITGMSR